MSCNSLADVLSAYINSTDFISTLHIPFQHVLPAASVLSMKLSIQNELLQLIEKSDFSVLMDSPSNGEQEHKFDSRTGFMMNSSFRMKAINWYKKQ